MNRAIKTVPHVSFVDVPRNEAAHARKIVAGLKLVLDNIRRAARLSVRLFCKCMYITSDDARWDPPL